MLTSKQVSLTAARGRGKSAALGLVIAGKEYWVMGTLERLTSRFLRQ